MYPSNYIFWAIALLLCGLCRGVRITYFHVPQFVNRHDLVTLECHFEMTMDPNLEKLHSVKWYRIDHKGQMQEFYSYKPGNLPPAKKHMLSGIKVDMRHSNVKQVALRRVSLETSGNYRCEVTSKNSPGFDSQFEEGKLVVLELPEEGPVISGGLPSYQLGENLELNCTSPRSYPPTILKWFINGKQVDSSLTYPTKRGPKNGLFRSQIGLNISVTQDLFRDGKIRIKCVGAIEDGLLHGISEGSSHLIETITLPEALKRERTEIYEVPLANSDIGIFASRWWINLLLFSTTSITLMSASRLTTIS